MANRALNLVPENLRAGFLAAGKTAVLHEREVSLNAEAHALEELQQGEGVTVTKCDRSLFEVRCHPLWDDYAAKNPNAKPLIEQTIKYRV
jgi:TRAP-type C4-dicarboxylate transport system substrate-binding protein